LMMMVTLYHYCRRGVDKNIVRLVCDRSAGNRSTKPIVWSIFIGRTCTPHSARVGVLRQKKYKKRSERRSVCVNNTVRWEWLPCYALWFWINILNWCTGDIYMDTYSSINNVTLMFMLPLRDLGKWVKDGIVEKLFQKLEPLYMRLGVDSSFYPSVIRVWSDIQYFG
jgi:hypothetical protein